MSSVEKQKSMDSADGMAALCSVSTSLSLRLHTSTEPISFAPSLVNEDTSFCVACHRVILSLIIIIIIIVLSPSHTGHNERMSQSQSVENALTLTCRSGKSSNSGFVVALSSASLPFPPFLFLVADGDGRFSPSVAEHASQDALRRARVQIKCIVRYVKER